jgi:hypothetical protein
VPRYRHPNTGSEIETSEADYRATYEPRGFVPREDHPMPRYRHPHTLAEVDATEEQYAASLANQGFVQVEAPAEETPDFKNMTRDDLNAYATDHGVEGAKSLPNKAAVIEAIEGAGGDGTGAGDERDEPGAVDEHGRPA